MDWDRRRRRDEYDDDMKNEMEKKIEYAKQIDAAMKERKRQWAEKA